MMDNTYLQEMVTRYRELLDNIRTERPDLNPDDMIRTVTDHFDTLYQDDIALLAGNDGNLSDEYYSMFETYAALNNNVTIPYHAIYQEMLEKEKQVLGSDISEDALNQLVDEEFLLSNFLSIVSDEDLMDPDECLRRFSNDVTQFDQYYNGKISPGLQSMMEETVEQLEAIKNQEQTQDFTTSTPSNLPRIPLHAWGAFARAIRDQKPETPEQEQAICCLLYTSPSPRD